MKLIVFEGTSEELRAAAPALNLADARLAVPADRAVLEEDAQRGTSSSDRERICRALIDRPMSGHQLTMLRLLHASGDVPIGSSEIRQSLHLNAAQFRSLICTFGNRFRNLAPAFDQRWNTSTNQYEWRLMRVLREALEECGLAQRAEAAPDAPGVR